MFLTKYDANDTMRLIGYQSSGALDEPGVREALKDVMRANHTGDLYSIWDAFLLGRMAGIRAERARRRGDDEQVLNIPRPFRPR